MTGRQITTLRIVLALLAALPGAGDAAVPGHLAAPDAPRLEDPDRLVAQFLAAVDRGELVVFGHTLSRAMLDPARVEYSYDLATRSTRIRVHAALFAPLPVPGRTNCEVRAVSAVIQGGRITEIESHVWLEE